MKRMIVIASVVGFLSAACGTPRAQVETRDLSAEADPSSMVQNTSDQTSIVPDVSIPRPSIPNPDLPQPDLPQPDLPQPDVPNPVFPEADFPVVEFPEITSEATKVRRATDGETVFVLDADVLFAFDSDELEPAAVAVLDEVIASIDGRGLDGSILAHGHTDSIGDDTYNDDLSLRRAAAVAEYLRNAPTLAGRQVATEGHGESRPVAANINADGSDNPDGRQLNRRVEIAVEP